MLELLQVIIWSTISFDLIVLQDRDNVSGDFKQEKGAIVDVQDSKGNTALHLTCAGELLLETNSEMWNSVRLCQKSYDSSSRTRLMKQYPNPTP